MVKENTKKDKKIIILIELFRFLSYDFHCGGDFYSFYSEEGCKTIR
jgi:hypothetical protein